MVGVGQQGVYARPYLLRLAHSQVAEGSSDVHTGAVQGDGLAVVGLGLRLLALLGVEVGPLAVGGLPVGLKHDAQRVVVDGAVDVAAVVADKAAHIVKRGVLRVGFHQLVAYLQGGFVVAFVVVILSPLRGERCLGRVELNGFVGIFYGVVVVAQLCVAVAYAYGYRGVGLYLERCLVGVDGLAVLFVALIEHAQIVGPVVVVPVLGHLHFHLGYQGVERRLLEVLHQDEGP